MKKILALLLASVMVLALLAGCGGGNSGNDSNTNTNQSQGNSTSGGDTSGGGDSSVPTIVWYQVGGGMPANIDSWTTAANAYLEEKLGVHLDVQCVSWSDWGNRRTMIVQTNEPYDIMFTDMGSYTSDIAMGAFADLTDMMSDVPGLTSLIPADYLKACEVNGRLYGIPAIKDSSMTNFFLWTKERIEPAYPGWENIHTLDQATPALVAMKDMFGEPPVLLNKDGISCVIGNRYDGMGIGLTPLGISYFDGSNKVVSVLEQEDVMSQLRILHQWMSDGLINSDAAVLGEASGMCGVSVAQGWPAAAQGWGEGRGAEVVVSQFDQSVLSNDTVRGSMACISASSSHKAEALKLLELVNTDSYLRDMLYYGEEGVNWEYVDVNGEQRVHKINTDWTMAGYTQGTFMTVTPTEEVTVNPYTTEVADQNANATPSPALGFYFDAQAAGVADKISACQAIFEGYKGILLTGTNDPETTVPQLMSEMRNAGFDDIVTAVQEQLDAYLG